MQTYAEDLERMQNANEIKTLKARTNGTQIAVYQKQHLSHCLFGLTQTQEKLGGAFRLFHAVWTRFCLPILICVRPPMAAPEWGVWWFIQGLVSQQGGTRRFILKGSWDVFGRGAFKDLQPFLQHLLPALQCFQCSVTEGGADRQIWNRVTNV